MNSRMNWHYVLNISYFALAGMEFLAEIFAVASLSMITRLCLPLILGLLYFSLSTKQNRFFYLLLLLLVLSNTFFFFRNSPVFFYGIVAFILLRIVSLVIILKETKDNNYLHIIVASFPFLVIFFYLISITNEITDIEFNTLILQSILISILAGVSITNYFKDENRQHSWLLISTLLFIGLRFIVFIERFVISDLSLIFNRPIAVILNTFAFYTFYKFVIEAEQNESYSN
ncbi:MAG: hypothetical protein IPP30_01050 [Flavobacterium sp.]|nr:hypothetical protein [Flavobacterium sp.]